MRCVSRQARRVERFCIPCCHALVDMCTPQAWVERDHNLSRYHPHRWNGAGLQGKSSCSVICFRRLLARARACFCMTNTQHTHFPQRPVLFERQAVGGEYGAGWKAVGSGKVMTTFFPGTARTPSPHTRPSSHAPTHQLSYCTILTRSKTCAVPHSLHNSLFSHNHTRRRLQPVHHRLPRPHGRRELCRGVRQPAGQRRGPCPHLLQPVPGGQGHFCSLSCLPPYPITPPVLTTPRFLGFFR